MLGADVGAVQIQKLPGCGKKARSSSGVSLGASPCSVLREAMVPPVESSKIFFIGIPAPFRRKYQNISTAFILPQKAD